MYDNFQLLQCSNQQLIVNTKRIIGDYNDSFWWQDIFQVLKFESVYDCLSCHIDVFNLILNKKVCISTIIHRAKEEDYEFNSQYYSHNKQNTVLETFLPFFYAPERYI